VASLLEATGLPGGAVERPGYCYLAAYHGARLVGVAGVQTYVDIAVLGTLGVINEMRHRGIGTALLAAARAAAHTRGASILYALAPLNTDEFFARYGFAAIPITEALPALIGTGIADRSRTTAETYAGCTAWLLDMSRDGIVTR
jgi:N-acetylglutamate synthase-like GNAT family acetyltransferase